MVNAETTWLDCCGEEEVNAGTDTVFWPCRGLGLEPLCLIEAQSSGFQKILQIWPPGADFSVSDQLPGHGDAAGVQGTVQRSDLKAVLYKLDQSDPE